jgi:hypothetical protein
MSALGQKADISGAKRHVRSTPESGHLQRTRPCLLCANSGRGHHRPSLPNSELTRSVIGPLSLYWTFAVNTRATWPIEHVAAGGAELLFILNKTLGYATRIRDSVPAKPHRIRRTCICILLRISDRG